MNLAQDLEASREFEMRTYLDSMQAMYDIALDQNGEVYDIAFDLTEGFTAITRASILRDSRIIRVLRYAVSPFISQMKFGQCFNIPSVERFERAKLPTTGASARVLGTIAPEIAQFARDHLDLSRFIWVEDRNLDTQLARDYAKKWTCSLVANQNAQTAYRNWRRELQELAVVNHLVASGYTKSSFRGPVKMASDVGVGQFTTEIKVKGRTVQKADIVFRSKKTRKLVLVEAKTVGVELDATKRIKECCDKAHDWASSEDLATPDVVTVIAGFFTVTGIQNLQASGVHVVWEHRLSDLQAFL